MNQKKSEIEIVVPASLAAHEPSDLRPIDPLNKRRQVIRFRLIWQGPLVWVAHLDRMRAFEKALLRAELPLAYSQGYNPRPQYVFGLPSGAGIASEAEYIDVSFEREIDPAEAAAKLDGALPPGLRLCAAGEVPVERAKKLMGSVRMADYRFEGKGIAEAFSKLLAADSLTVDRFSKGRTKAVDLRPMIKDHLLHSPDSLSLRVMAGSRENLRPDLLLDALKLYAGYEEALGCDITKEEVWIRIDKKDPFVVRPLPRRDELNELPYDGA